MLQAQRKLYKKVSYQVGMISLDSNMMENIKRMKRIYHWFPVLIIFNQYINAYPKNLYFIFISLSY